MWMMFVPHWKHTPLRSVKEIALLYFYVIVPSPSYLSGDEEVAGCCDVTKLQVSKVRNSHAETNSASLSPSRRGASEQDASNKEFSERWKVVRTQP
jgi:hypothetical protein